MTGDGDLFTYPDNLITFPVILIAFSVVILTEDAINLSGYAFYFTYSAKISAEYVKRRTDPVNQFARLMKISQPMWKSRQGMIHASHGLRRKGQGMRKK
jgi:hypothetical protein